MDYRYEATSVTGFVQQLGCNYLPHGYWFYVTGRVPDGKDPALVDRKLMDRYGVGLSRQQRARRKAAGQANVHYLRHEQFWVLIATHGQHQFFAEEAKAIRDARSIPIQYAGYSLSVKRGHFLKKMDDQETATPDGRYRVRIQIGRERYRDIKAGILDIATRRTAEELGWEFWNMPYEPYAPIRRQWLNLLRLVNERRGTAGLDKLSPEILRYRRKIVKPFEREEVSAAA